MGLFIDRRAGLLDCEAQVCNVGQGAKTRTLNAMTSDQSQSPQDLSVLDGLGWTEFFAEQATGDDLGTTVPVRVTEVHRSRLRALGDGIEVKLPPRKDATVGDWLLLDPEDRAKSRLLERRSLIKRRAPGANREVQLIAANIDTAFIVTSCNQDFSVARLERYIALVFEAEVTPVIVLTKVDLCADPAPFVADAQAISDQVAVVTLDGRGDEPAAKLAQWCTPGQTVAFLGSSGVGKSTMTNALAGTNDIETQAVREVDARGRHTTTTRHLHVLPAGFTVLDTPGMRELKLAEAATGLSEVFADLQELATQCKFRDCVHETEPGCAVNAALRNGDVDAARLARWQKLVIEDEYHTATLGTRKAKDRGLSKSIRSMHERNKKGPQ